ncbi:MAG: Flavin-dependent thymidylate synthase [Candidatus Thorarchaeota archaeon]|nr:MAG: Flavin-dependent thymidylate synthase [Candidatus Thorarchaeota archaeon]
MLMTKVEWTRSGVPSKESIIDATAAGMVSRHDDEYHEFVTEITFERAREFLEKMIRLGHDSVLEHIVFQFWVSISRVASHQLVRHRMASYTQKSHRKERILTEEDFVIPDNLSEEDREEWIKDIRQQIAIYEKWLEKGYDADIARRKLPQETRTDLVMTINARSLRNFFKLRAEHVADFEIREMAQKMYHLIKKEQLDFLFYDIGIEN